MNYSKRDSKLIITSLNETVYLENNFSALSSHNSQVANSRVRASQLICVHGLGTYAGWFNQLSDELSESKISTTCFDLPGFGRSGKRGEIKSYKNWIEATSLAWQESCQNKNLDSFLLGHSLGGVIALAALPYLEPKPKGIILTVPALSANYKTFKLWDFTLPVFLKALIDFPEKTSYPISEEVFESIKDGTHQLDFLTGEIKPKLFLEILKMTPGAWLQAWQMKDIPLLMITSDQDPITDNKAAKSFFSLSNSQNKVLKTFPNTKHDLFVLPEAAETIELICDWLQDLEANPLTIQK